MDVRQRDAELAQHVDVELEFDVRGLAVHAVDLREPQLIVLVNGIVDELLGGERVRALLIRRPREGAKLAFHPADVRLVHVDVLDEVDVVRATAKPTRTVGEVAEGEQVAGLEDRDAVLEVEPLSGLDLLANLRKRVWRGENGDQKLLSTMASAMASSSARLRAPSRLARALVA
jgi:hypothetical protein